jgi:alkanesulfonate monooxygenase SsuD/methylene tetrahydromethanopterin reductase-like flavin-dependent oxidoreductase (luciferase family)
VNIWPRPLQTSVPVWITGVGNPRTMQMCLERNFGFNYLSWFGAKLTGQRIFDRFWEIADQVGVPRNPYRLGFLQTIAVAETDERAETEYAAHLEYAFHKGLGAIPPHKIGMPGGIDIRGVQAIVRDPGDFGMYHQMRTAPFRDLVDAGVVICGSPATVREQLRDFLSRYGVGVLHAMLGFGSLPRHMVMKNIQLFAEEVAPYLRDLWTDGEHPNHWWPKRLGGDPTPITTGVGAQETTLTEHTTTTKGAVVR